MLEENNTLAMYQVAQAQRIKNYINGIHNVLSRPDFQVNNDTFNTAKIVLRSVDNIVDFLTGYICGNPVSISGDESISQMVQTIYKKGFYNKTDYTITRNLIMYGNAFEYVYKDNKGIIKSKVINNTDSYAIYENGEYTKFIEKWNINPITDDTMEREYTNTLVNEYVNGQLKNTYNNPTGLPIHYTSDDMNRTNLYGIGVVEKLIPVMDEIEQLLSKMADSINTLSLNPLLSISGQRMEDSTDANTVGQTINLDDGSTMGYITANLDYESIKLLLDNLIQQFYTIANVPSALFNSGNIANVSETSLSLLFNNTSNFAKRISFGLLEGFGKRLEYMSKLIAMDVTNTDITFNYNAPVDYKSMIEAMEIQYNCGALSKESFIRQSPYSQNVNREMKLINDNENNNVTEM